MQLCVTPIGSLIVCSCRIYVIPGFSLWSHHWLVKQPSGGTSETITWLVEMVVEAIGKLQKVSLELLTQWNIKKWLNDIHKSIEHMLKEPRHAECPFLPDSGGFRSPSLPLHWMAAHTDCWAPRWSMLVQMVLEVVVEVEGGGGGVVEF